MDKMKEKFFSDYYSKYFNKLKIFAHSFLGDWDRAEEATQDTFHIAWVKIDDFMASENPTGWLINTLKFTLKNIQRRDYHQTKLFVSLNELGDISAADIPESNIDGEGICKSVLSEEEYYMLQRAVLDKVTYKELSKELGIKLWACQKRMQRIYQKLRKFFERRI